MTRNFKAGEYQIYKMYHPERDEYETVFFTPVKSMCDLFWKRLDLADFKEHGYKVVGFICVDQETYLKERLNVTVEDYLHMEKEEQKTVIRFNRGEISFKCYEKTMEMIQDHKWTLLKQLRSQVKRLLRHDYDVDNEIAIQLYDQYLQVL